MKVLFLPLSIIGGLLAGMVGKKVFARVWSLIDDQEPPQAEHREISRPKLVAALALEGAVFGATRGIFDHQARRSFQRFTGSWPGEEKPDPE